VAATVGAVVVASAGEPLGASYPATLTGVEVVHTCRVEMELGFHLKTDVILSLFVRYLRVLLGECPCVATETYNTMITFV
jgi:hypothetical protein